MSGEVTRHLRFLFTVAAVPILGCPLAAPDNAGSDGPTASTTGPGGNATADPATGADTSAGPTTGPTTAPTGDPTDPTGEPSDVCSRYFDHCNDCMPPGGSSGGSYGTYGGPDGGSGDGYYGTYGGGESYGYAPAPPIGLQRHAAASCSSTDCQDALDDAAGVGRACLDATEDFFACLSLLDCEEVNPCASADAARRDACGEVGDEGPACSGNQSPCGAGESCCDGLVCVQGACKAPCDPGVCTGSYTSGDLFCITVCRANEECCFECNDGMPARCF